MSTSVSSTDTTKSKVHKWLSARSPWFRRVIRFGWIAFLVVMLGLPLYVMSVDWNVFGLFGGMPSLADVENPENDLSSALISADGQSLGRYFRFNRSHTNFNKLSDDLVNTLVLSEDHRFNEHSGFDLPSYF